MFMSITTRIQWEFVNQTDCQNVWNVISNTYQHLYPETELYKPKKECGMIGIFVKIVC